MSMARSLSLAWPPMLLIAAVRDGRRVLVPSCPKTKVCRVCRWKSSTVSGDSDVAAMEDQFPTFCSGKQPEGFRDHFAPIVSIADDADPPYRPQCGSAR